MTTRYSSLVLGLLLIVNLATASIDQEVLTRDAISRIHWDFQTELAFNETTEEDGILTVGRFDPTIVVQVSGSALVFGRFDELERFLFSDFDYAGSARD